MEEYQAEQKPKRKVVSFFDKFAILIFIGILFYIISGKMGCDMVTKEEKIEWTE